MQNIGLVFFLNCGLLTYGYLKSLYLVRNFLVLLLVSVVGSFPLRAYIII